ncbi:glycosyltransferase [Acuticoccus sp. MNP-M23]|uniref:glycosyltransferase family 2 protein n=1 Tax=Acuticoccus sp. MNP-M23 TaxID=3072793 RepID=UPI0028150724|nr:glycosyltransferase [Acuticoccus sp. MNP-M23]WMS40974.1 glycosyltransferase [Acuticoccus sp. MNP-M23]
MTEKTAPPAHALDAFPEPPLLDPLIEIAGATLVFPTDAAWLTVCLDLPRGTYRLSLALEAVAIHTLDAKEAAVRVEVETAAGWVPLPMRGVGWALEAVFTLDAPLRAMRLMPQGSTRLQVSRFEVAPAPPWEPLLPDWQVGPLRLPHTQRSALAPHGGSSTQAALPGWPPSVRIGRYEGIGFDGHFLEMAPGGALSLSFDTPIGPGRVRFEADFTGGDTIAWVAPFLFAANAEPNDHPLGRFRRRTGARYRAEITLTQPVQELVLQPRQERGGVAIHALTIRPVPPAVRVLSLGRDGLSAARRQAGRLVDHWLDTGPGRDGALRKALRGAGETAWRERRHIQQSGAADKAPAETPASPPPPTATAIAETPTVSVVTATRDAPHHIQRYLETIAQTDWPALDVVLVDNGTTDPAALDALAKAEARGMTVLRDRRPFNFAALSNLGAAASRGDLLIFANNDLEFTDPGWLRAMVSALRNPAVGVAGALLHYPDGRVQHAGITLAGEARVRHTERFAPGRSAGYAGRRNRVTETVAVTGALLGVSRSLFETLGGFRAERYPVLYNDVDLCLRARRLGLSSVLVGTARAVHHESISIGPRQTDNPFARGGPVWRMERAVEADRFREDWAAWLDNDPCYPAACDPLEADFLKTV